MEDILVLISFISEQLENVFFNLYWDHEKSLYQSYFNRFISMKSVKNIYIKCISRPALNKYDKNLFDQKISEDVSLALRIILSSKCLFVMDGYEDHVEFVKEMGQQLLEKYHIQLENTNNSEIIRKLLAKTNVPTDVSIVIKYEFDVVQTTVKMSEDSVDHLIIQKFNKQ